VPDPARAKKDDQVGDFYLGQGDSQGAYLRYQDAIKADPADIDAIFGAAEAARRLGKFSEAARNYQTYLEIEPNGSKAKRALKALNELPKKN
jgi:Tfp pilus assembly protein PilF